MTEKEQTEEKQTEGYTAQQYVRMMRTLSKVRDYVLVGITTNMKARNVAIEQGNDIGFHYFQGGLDVCTDIKSILDGYELQVFKEKIEPDVMHQ